VAVEAERGEEGHEAGRSATSAGGPSGEQLL
jgi:hypothetical protein